MHAITFSSLNQSVVNMAAQSSSSPRAASLQSGQPQGEYLPSTTVKFGLEPTLLAETLNNPIVNFLNHPLVDVVWNPITAIAGTLGLGAVFHKYDERARQKLRKFQKEYGEISQEQIDKRLAKLREVKYLNRLTQRFALEEVEGMEIPTSQKIRWLEEVRYQLFSSVGKEADPLLEKLKERLEQEKADETGSEPQV